MPTPQVLRLLAVLVVLLVAPCAHAALTSGEKQALAQIRTAFPSLAHVQQDVSVYPYLGGPSRSWPSSFDSLCLGADGYEIHGVRCVSGHVGEFFFSDAWGAKDPAKPLDLVPSLSHLQKLYVHEFPFSFAFSFNPRGDCARVLIAHGPSTLTLPTNLQSLNLVPRVDHPLSAVSLGFQALGTHLTSISVYSQDKPLAISSVPPHVKTLNLTAITVNSLDFSFPTTLETLIVSSESGSQISRTVHASLADCLSLETLSFTGSIADFVNSLPSLNHTSVANITIKDTNGISDAEMKEIMCEKISTENIVALSLQRAPLPRCSNGTEIRALSALKSFSSLYPPGFAYSSDISNNLIHRLPMSLETFELQLLPSGLQEIDLDAFLYAFPRLQSFTVASSANGTIPNQFAALSSLSSISLSLPLQGTLPSNFFERMPQLRSFEIHGGVSGDFPNSGLEFLEELDASQNLFTSWLPLTGGGAPNLVSINFNSNALSTIPDDATFANMTKLKSFSMALNDAPGAGSLFLPQFWANHPAIEYVELQSGGFHGALPATLSSPRLTFLDLAGNQICGNLFEISSPIGFKDIDLSVNIITGTIPASWKDLSVAGALSLNHNQLNGTFPDPFLSRVSVMDSLSLDNNFFYGAIPNLTEFNHLKSLSLEHTALDLCTGSPYVPSSLTACQLEPVAVSHCHCAHLWTACNSDCGGFTPYVYTPAVAESTLPPVAPASTCAVAPPPPSSSQTPGSQPSTNPSTPGSTPSATPSTTPSSTPSGTPSSTPSSTPSTSPASTPTTTGTPSSTPSSTPSNSPSSSPSSNPSTVPTHSDSPTNSTGPGVSAASSIASSYLLLSALVAVVSFAVHF